MKKYDIIISGGGMIGSIAAAVLSQKGLSILLIEAKEHGKIQVKEQRNLRVSALSADNISYLIKHGIFANLLQNRIQPYEKMQVWDNRGNGEVSFHCYYAKQNYLGYLVENNNLVHACWKTLNDNSDNCDTIEQQHITDIENEDSQIRLTTSDGQSFKSRLLIAAEGRQSAVRQIANIKCQEKSYQQRGIVAYINLPKAPTLTALQAFNAGGPLGILPVDAENCIFSIVWSVPEDKAEHYLTTSEENFQHGVAQAIGKDFGTVKLLSQRAAFPLSQLYAQDYFANRIVLCGDSAHGVHPLAGLGVNLGIGDVQLLASLIDKNTLKDEQLLQRTLKKYQRRRKSKVQETSEMMSFLHHLFKDDKYLKKPLRNIGMKIVNNMPIKNWLMQQAGS